ncbi:HNH endonuclease signature motif containing protein [Asticcacaulis sp. BYS171W]|uniref:HNH endonuclease signature motif containing protein n=1 Tax=Asticcacaulis aquaticus TaxID=2984212 RepID=A0ABT5HT61_9CAUL|nr:HNH endonuclease signature motif containing protein [Asticcacaulis aquaticus]MDC7683252.1 HNH endonuclease signature motif containing protein [Asticcacaulis aquaticus]
MKGVWIAYSEAELDWIERHKTMVRKEAHKLFVETFARDDVAFQNYNALCKRKGWLTGRTGRIEPDNVPHNEGQKMPFHPNSAATRFKKGSVPANRKFFGHERVGKDGYIEMSVDQVNPHTGHSRRYMHKHRYLWEQQHGPVPEGHVLKCLDGDRTNTSPENWECVPRGVAVHLGGRAAIQYDHADPELKPSIMAVAKVKYQVRQRRAKKGGLLMAAT